MKKKTQVIASALTTIALCLSLAIGGTFALFTSESQVAVNIVTGTVNVTANADEESLTLYSPTSINSDGTINNATNAATTTAFANGGTATLEGGEITLDRMTAGDKATFDIVIHNGSNVKVKYRTVIKVTEDTGLFSGLTITVSGVAYNGATTYSQWANADSADITVPVAVELPANAGNAYQNKSCKISYSVEAVQGNVAPEIPETNVVYIYTATDLRLFAASVNNGNTYEGKTVKLMNNVDLAGVAWTPIGTTTNYFKGTFDGNGKTISNLTVSGNNDNAGLFGHSDGGTFTNFTIYNANVSGKDRVAAAVANMFRGTANKITVTNSTIVGGHYVAGITGYSYGTVTDCTVSSTTVTAVPYLVGSSYDNGDKVGGIIGWSASCTLTGNNVSNVTVTAYRDLGGIAGYVGKDGTDPVVTGNTVNGLTLIQDSKNGYLSSAVTTVAAIVGREAFDVDETANTATNVTILRQFTVSTKAELSAALNKTYSADTTIKLMNDIDLGGAEWGAHALNAGNNAALTIDGNGKTIKGLKSTEYYNLGGFYSTGLITAIGSSFSSVTFKNLTVSGAELTNNYVGDSATGVFVGDTNTVNVTFDTCKVIDAKINSYKYAGGFIGYTQDVNTDKKKVKFTNCAVIDSEIKTTDSSAGGLVGHSYTALDISKCEIKGTTAIACAEDRTGKDAKAGYLIGTVNRGSATISNITVDNTVGLDTKNGKTYDTTKYIGRNYGTVTGVTVNA